MTCTWTPVRRVAAASLAALVLAGFVPSTRAAARAGVARPTPDSSAVRARLAHLPLRFEANRGQAAPEAKYVARGAGFALLLTASQAVWSLDGAAVRMRAVGASPAAPVGLDPLAGRTSYLSSARSTRDVPAYGRVAYAGVYPGVDLVFHGTNGAPEYDFVVAPGASPDAVRLSFEGADAARVDANGDLVLSVAGREVRQHAPRVYQDVGGARRAVSGAFVAHGPGDVRFAVGAYDRGAPLVVDPVVSFSTFLGGDHYDEAEAVAVDAAGAVYVVGSAGSPSFPTTAGAFQTGLAGQSGAFVTKLDLATNAIVYSTFLAGSFVDGAASIAVDATGAAYVAGDTLSGDFPTTPGAFQTGRTSDGLKGFVAKLAPAGDALVYSTLLGGSSDDIIHAIAIDAAGEAVVAGNTSSPDFPTTPGAVQATHGGGFFDAFVTKLDATGASLVFSTYLGGSAPNIGSSVAVDAAGGVYVAGTTLSTDLPATPGAAQPANGGDFDVYVAKLDPAGRQFQYLTYLGGASAEGLIAVGLAVDGQGSAYVTGDTDSPDFPTTAGAVQPGFGGGFEDAFVAKLSPTGTAFVYSTLLGGADDDHGSSIAVDASGLATVAGYTHSGDFPTAAPALDRLGGGSIFESTDGGATWTHESAGVPTSAVTALAVDARDPSKVYAGSEREGVFVSADGGLSWRASNAGLPSRQINALAVDPAVSGVVYAAIRDFDYTSGAVYKSTDGGATWTAAGDATFSLAVLALAVSPSSPNVVYAAGFPDASGVGGVFTSTDGGATWSGPALADKRPTSLAVDPTNPNVAYAGTFFFNVFKTTDGGRTWKEQDTGLKQNVVSSILFDPRSSSTIYLSTYASDRGADGGVYRSTNGGASWQRVSPPFFAATAVRVDPADSSKLYAAGYNGAFQSTDGGASWDGSRLLTSAVVRALTVVPSGPTRLIAGLAPLADGFVTRVSADGSALVYSTYVGSTGRDEAYGVAVDAEGGAYVVGLTGSGEIATPGAPQTAFGGGGDAFVAKIETGLLISGAALRGRKLVVSGYQLSRGDEVLVDGEALPTSAARQSRATVLVAKNAARAIAPGQTATLQVRTRDGAVSPGFRFTRPQ